MTRSQGKTSEGQMAAQHAHVSRVPISPRGRNTRISTSIRNGSSGADPRQRSR